MGESNAILSPLGDCLRLGYKSPRLQQRWSCWLGKIGTVIQWIWKKLTEGERFKPQLFALFVFLPSFPHFFCPYSTSSLFPFHFLLNYSTSSHHPSLLQSFQLCLPFLLMLVLSIHCSIIFLFLIWALPFPSAKCSSIVIRTGRLSCWKNTPYVLMKFWTTARKRYKKVLWRQAILDASSHLAPAPMWEGHYFLNHRAVFKADVAIQLNYRSREPYLIVRDSGKCSTAESGGPPAMSICAAWLELSGKNQLFNFQ